MKRTIFLGFMIFSVFGCSDEIDKEIAEIDKEVVEEISNEEISNEENQEDEETSGNEDENNINLTETPIYYFYNGALNSLTFDDKGDLLFKNESESVKFLNDELYGIAYDAVEQDFFGFNDAGNNTPRFESFNIKTKTTTTNLLCDFCNDNYSSVLFNSNSNKKIFIKYGTSFGKYVFQEVNNKGEVTKESPEVDLGIAVETFIFIPTLDSYVYLDRTDVVMVSASDFTLKRMMINIDTLGPDIGDGLSSGKMLNYDKKNDVLYYVRSNGVFKIDINRESVEKLNTNWIEFFKTTFGDKEKLRTPTSIYFPPTNEIIIRAIGFWGSNVGSNKFFAINLNSNTAREIKTNAFHSFFGSVN